MLKLLLPVFLLLLPVLTPARADVVVERKVTSGSTIRPMRLKFKGDRARIELPAQTGRLITLLIDLGKDEIYNLIPEKKYGYRGSLSERRKTREQSLKSHGIEPGMFRPVATGKKKKIGDWDCEEYLVADVGLSIWVAPAFPHAAEIQAQLARFSRAESGGALSPDCMGLPGLVVQSESAGAQGAEVTTLVSAKEEPVAESEFDVPKNYEINPFPTSSPGSFPGQSGGKPEAPR